MAQQTAVIDACVLVKLFAKEIDTSRATDLMKEHIEGHTLLIIPEIAFAEVLNALKYKGVSLEHLREANKALWQFQLSVAKIHPSLLEMAIVLAWKYDFTVYDAIYVALSDLHDTVLITADEELAKFPRTTLLRQT